MVRVSDRAFGRLRTVLQDRHEAQLGLRLDIQGGGCAGFSYDFQLIDSWSKDDDVLKSDQYPKVFVAINRELYTWIGDQSVIDFESTSVGSKFVLNNSQDFYTCGCKASFHPTSR